jgi:maleylacetoacetate isomerase
MKLYSYFRSSAAYRVRIGLALKGIAFETIAVNLVDGEQRNADFLSRNPQGLVPALELDEGSLLTQSTAILEWLEESYPDPPLYPADPLERARCRALCQHIACDIHPLNNLRVLRYLREDFRQDQDSIDHWYSHWIQRGFDALEAEVARESTPFSLGENPGMFELMLVPQMYNARRFNVSLDAYPHLLQRDTRCQQHPAFVEAAPEKQPDANAHRL